MFRKSSLCAPRQLCGFRAIVSFPPTVQSEASPHCTTQHAPERDDYIAARLLSDSQSFIFRLALSLRQSIRSEKCVFPLFRALILDRRKIIFGRNFVHRSRSLSNSLASSSVLGRAELIGERSEFGRCRFKPIVQ